ncbi:MAG TPA: ATP-binding protein [Allosphingosinicella sp.]
MTKPWQSAGLEEDNPFSLSFIVQGVLDLCSYEPYERQNEHKSAIRDEIVPILLREIDSDDGALSTRGSIRIEPYPPSAYLTQLVFRTLTRLLDPSGDDHKRVSGHVRVWARGEIYRQLALIASDSRIADPLQLAYATILLATASPDEDLSPEEKGLTREALKKFFSCQLTDGTWPASQPLFHYPKVGNALCFDYELLAELLRCQPLQLDLLEFLPELRNAVTHLRHSAFEIRRNISAWASGHHPQIQGPESWSTASVYDFIHALDRLVAEAVRRTLFKEVRAVYQPPERSSEEPRELDGFAPTFLDADVKVDGKKRSLRRTLRDYFVVPISREKHIVANGGQLSAHTPMSAILFGPPGTSKTQLAKMIGKFLGWPVLSIDPSYLVQDGIDRLYARANKLFSMLTMTEQVVVLLDEFDELGRDRSQSPEILSRFITTSMLPKLAAVNDERKLVFLLATNFVTQFDAAFSRRGRFDMILQVMPPTASAKQGYGPWSEILSASLGDLQGKLKKQALDCLADLTFLETQQLVSKLADRDGDPHDDFLLARDRGTLNQPNGDRGTWKESSREEEPLNRLPLVSVQAQAPLPLKTRRRRRQSRREAAATNAVQGPAV